MTPPPRRLLRIHDVTATTGLSRSTIYRQMKAGTFPAQVRASARVVAWRREDIDTWLDDLHTGPLETC